jgi:hypothetical protein
MGLFDGGQLQPMGMSSIHSLKEKIIVDLLADMRIAGTKEIGRQTHLFS